MCSYVARSRQVRAVADIPALVRELEANEQLSRSMGFNLRFNTKSHREKLMELADKSKDEKQP